MSYKIEEFEYAEYFINLAYKRFTGEHVFEPWMVEVNLNLASDFLLAFQGEEVPMSRLRVFGLGFPGNEGYKEPDANI